MSSQKIVDKVQKNLLTPEVFDSSSADSHEYVWKVSEWLSRTRCWLESHYGSFWLQGEISNLTRASSGHVYFVLKEHTAQLRCVFFKMYATRCSVELKNGLQIEALVQATLYEERGDLQVRVERIRAVGVGDLWQRFLQLKAKLSEAGWFDAAHKKELPISPRRVGILTSLQAAALRDVLITIQQRAPSVAVVIYPIPVQGEDAPSKIAAMITKACIRAEVDVLILCRGGGSLEDLAAFNDERVAAAIYQATLPLISGVGHETDFTIADFVADVRASTPTGAAVEVVPDELAQREQLKLLARRAIKVMRHRLECEQLKYDALAQRLRSPVDQLRLDKQRLLHLQQRWLGIREHLLREAQWRMQQCQQRLLRVELLPDASVLVGRAEKLRRAMQHEQARWLAGLAQRSVQHASANPLAPLARGYAWVRTAPPELRSLRSVHDVSVGESLQISLHDGTIDVIVTSK